jgi:hypothetical protein
MRKSVFTLAAALLGAAGLASANPAQKSPEPQTLIGLDFSKSADQAVVRLDGTASPSFTSSGRLELLDGGTSDASVAFLETPLSGSDYLASFDFQVQPNPGDTNPGECFCFVAQTAGLGYYGGAGAGGGYAPDGVGTLPDPTTPAGGGFPGYSYAIEFNSGSGQGLPDDAGGRYTIALDLNGSRSKIGITPFDFVDAGVMHAEVRVTPGRLALTLTRQGETAPVFTFASPNWLVNFFQTPKPLYFGFTGGTSGAAETVDVLKFTLQTGLQPPAAPKTQNSNG